MHDHLHNRQSRFIVAVRVILGGRSPYVHSTEVAEAPARPHARTHASTHADVRARSHADVCLSRACSHLSSHRPSPALVVATAFASENGFKRTWCKIRSSFALAAGSVHLDE